jgi:hypothetical protein
MNNFEWAVKMRRKPVGRSRKTTSDTGTPQDIRNQRVGEWRTTMIARGFRYKHKKRLTHPMSSSSVITRQRGCTPGSPEGRCLPPSVGVLIVDADTDIVGVSFVGPTSTDYARTAPPHEKTTTRLSLTRQLNSVPVTSNRQSRSCDSVPPYEPVCGGVDPLDILPEEGV